MQLCLRAGKHQILTHLVYSNHYIHHTSSRCCLSYCLHFACKYTIFTSNPNSIKRFRYRWRFFICHTDKNVATSIVLTWLRISMIAREYCEPIVWSCKRRARITRRGRSFWQNNSFNLFPVRHFWSLETTNKPRKKDARDNTSKYR